MTTPDNARQDPLLTPKEAAAYMGVGESTLYHNYREKWHLQHVRIGRKVMFRRAHLDAFLKRHTEVK